jgi:hypothetical protein
MPEEQENTMTSKTAISKFMLAGALGVVAATASLGPTIRSTDKQPHFAGQLVDEKILSESSTRALGVSRPERIELSANHAQTTNVFGSSTTKPKQDALTITFGIEGPGDDESNALVKGYKASYAVDLYAAEVTLGGLAVVAKVVANGLSLDDIQRTTFYQSECMSAECTVVEIAASYLDRLLLAEGTQSAQSRTLNGRTHDAGALSWERDTLLGRNPGSVVRDDDGLIRVIIPYVDDPSVKQKAPEAGKESYYALSDAMDRLQDALTDGSSSGSKYGLWYVHSYEQDSSSWPTLRVLTDVIYGLSMHNAGSILFCANEKDPVYVYEVGVRASSVDDLETFQAHHDELLSALEGSAEPPSPTDFHAYLISDDVHLDVTHIRYRDGLETSPIVLRNDAAREFLASCSDSLIDP